MAEAIDGRRFWQAILAGIDEIDRLVPTLPVGPVRACVSHQRTLVLKRQLCHAEVFNEQQEISSKPAYPTDATRQLLLERASRWSQRSAREERNASR